MFKSVRVLGCGNKVVLEEGNATFWLDVLHWGVFSVSYIRRLPLRCIFYTFPTPFRYYFGLTISFFFMADGNDRLGTNQ